MKTIRFSEKELEFIRQQYQVELKEAEEYVQNIKNIVEKIGVSETVAVLEPIKKEPKRRGRKPTVVEKAEPVKKKKRAKRRRSRSDKGKKRKQEQLPVIQGEGGMSETERDFLKKKELSQLAGSKKPVIRRRRRKTKARG